MKEKELKKSSEFQQLIIRISTLFIDLPANEIDQAIHDQFEEIGEFFKADRVAITRYSESGEVLASSHMWCSDNINREKFASILMGATYPNLIKHIKHKKYWFFSDPDDFSHWHPERETIAKTNFKSGLVIVLNIEATVVEVFFINFMRSTPVWSKEIIDQVKLLGNVFSNTLKSKQAEQALEKNAKFKQLVSRVSTKFTGLSGVEFEHAIQNSLAEIGSYFGVDTVRLYRLSPKGDVLKIRNIWRSENLAPAEEMPEIHKLKYPNLATHYSQGGTVVFDKFNDSPKWPEMRKY